jgi:IS30 family transposase
MTQYQHLNNEERFYIWNALRTGHTQAEVARHLNRNPATIGREITRNKYPQAKIYTYHWALEIVRRRKERVSSSKRRKLTPEITGMIEKLIRQRLSPEQVSGYLKMHLDISISHETIYRFIYSDQTVHEQLKPFFTPRAQTPAQTVWFGRSCQQDTQSGIDQRTSEYRGRQAASG